jgi:hypothetical protein
MRKTAYRLSDYKVIENNLGDLWWETHIGLGSLKSGKCFINGDILFIAPGDITGPGYLKGEFLDHLNKLPKWERTEFYCASYKIYKCQSVSRKPLFEKVKNRLQDEVILRKNELIQKEEPKTTQKSIKADKTAPVSYKLGRYEIIEINNGQLFWKSTGGSGSLKKGRCHIKGSILFLEAGETERSSLMRGEFRQLLNRLTDWERTQYFCPSYAIYYSNTGAACRRLGEDKDVNRTIAKNVIFNNKSYGAGISIKPIILNRGEVKEKLESFFNLFKILEILIFKLLFEVSQIVYTVFRKFINRWIRFRG